MGFIEMDMIKIIGIAMVSAAFSVVLKKKNPEFSLLISFLAGILLLFMILSAIQPLLERISSFMQVIHAGSEQVQILFKALGVCFITQIACDCCKDMGESAIAAKVETAGKVTVLVLSLPLFEQMLTVAGELIGR